MWFKNTFHRLPQASMFCSTCPSSLGNAMKNVNWYWEVVILATSAAPRSAALCSSASFSKLSSLLWLNSLCFSASRSVTPTRPQILHFDMSHSEQNSLSTVSYSIDFTLRKLLLLTLLPSLLCYFVFVMKLLPKYTMCLLKFRHNVQDLYCCHVCNCCLTNSTSHITGPGVA